MEKTIKFRLIPSTHSTCAAMSIFPSGPIGRAVTAERDRVRVSSDADVKAPARFPILLDATGRRVSIAATTGS
jgi:hypothetical protein